MKEQLTKPKDRAFFALFRPLIPSIIATGIIAQIISGLTEAVTVGRVVLSELQGVPVWLQIPIIIVAVSLVVLFLEYGGRKFMQVLARVVVWWRFSNRWYIILFVVVSLVTLSIGVLSFQLSTKGVTASFIYTSSVLDISEIKQAHKRESKQLDNHHLQTRSELLKQHKEQNEAIKATYKPQMKNLGAKVDEYRVKADKGIKWATSWVSEYENQLNGVEQTQANELAKFVQLQNIERANLDSIQSIERVRIQKAHNIYLADIQKKHNENDQGQKRKTELLSGVLTYLVGACVCLAIVCIIVGEIFKRGAEIKTEYVDTEKEPITSMLWYKITERIDTSIRAKINGLFSVATNTQQSPVLGFNFQNNTNVPTTNKQAVVTDINGQGGGINEKDLVIMALRSAKGFLSSYNSKPETENNILKRKEWGEKVNELEQRLKQYE